MTILDLPTPQARRLWRMLDRKGLLIRGDDGQVVPDCERAARLVREHLGDDSFKGWVIRCALDGTRPLLLWHAVALADALGEDVRWLAYDEPGLGV